MEEAKRGWDSDLPEFVRVDRGTILRRLCDFVADASESQVRAWRDAIPLLQSGGREMLLRIARAPEYGTILEYELPMESRRPDGILLIDGAVVVLELKGKTEPSQADIDQVAAYARDLRSYHRDCEHQPVEPILVPTRLRGLGKGNSGVRVCGPDVLEEVVRNLPRQAASATPVLQFLDDGAYRPLPTLVQAARELLASGRVRRVSRAAAATEPTVAYIQEVAVRAAQTKTRHLVLVTGVPGAGKTLVGLQTVHAHWLDALAVPRPGGKPTAPAVFLSGNGPLVEVLQHELTRDGAEGKTFVRGVKDYVKRYGSKRSAVPPEHVLVYDEAQRAWDRAQVAASHDMPIDQARGEPEMFVEFAERIPEWCVVIGLIGTGQEIHKGEEAGIAAWREAVQQSPRAHEWTIHAPSQVAPQMHRPDRPPRVDTRLNLTTELRFHLTKNVHRFVAGLLEDEPAESLRELADGLERDGYHLRITRNLDVAKQYLWDRYASEPDKRFGLVASSRDRSLATEWGIPNDFQSTKRVRLGPWYGDAQDHPQRRSCRLLTDVATEFGTQGLELDATLLAWGSDYLRTTDPSGRTGWSSALAAKYQKKGAAVHDAHQLRRNSYRVLLTRGREATVAFLPDNATWDDTFTYLVAAGFRVL